MNSPIECKSIKQAKEVLDRMKPFEQLSEETRDQLAHSAVLQNLRSDQCLWRYGDSCEYFACVVTGVIEVSRPTHQGSENCMGLFGPGDMIGMSAFFNKTPFPGTSRAIASDTTVLKFYLRNLLHAKTKESEELSRWTREMFLRHEQILRDKIDILTAGSVEASIFEFLLQLRRRFGVRLGRTKWCIPLSVSKTQVAKIIDARSETVFRILTKWKKEGHIEWGSDKIVICDLEHLEQYVLNH